MTESFDFRNVESVAACVLFSAESLGGQFILLDPFVTFLELVVSL